MTPELEYWAQINADLNKTYQPITRKGAVPADADHWNPKLNTSVGDKKDLL
jgi:hypothetical protein